MSTIVFRVDSSLELGSGHVMRCLTLAERLLKDGAKILFLSREHRGNLCGLILAKGHTLVRLEKPDLFQSDDQSRHVQSVEVSQENDAMETQFALKNFGPIDLLVVDHYGLGAIWERAMRPFVASIMVIDDLANREHDCDILIDQNLSVQGENRYDKLLSLGTTRLLGTNYALLRQEFREMRVGAVEYTGVIKKICIFFGGSDTTNETEKALAAVELLSVRCLEVDVILGANNPNRSSIEAICSNMKVKMHVAVDNMAELMASADIGIGAGGGAMWERCCVGLPSIVISLAENQVHGCRALARSGGAIYLGDCKDVSVDLLKSALEVVFSSPHMLLGMRDFGIALVDGLGVERVNNVIKKNIYKVTPIYLRKATESDSRSIFAWRNDKKTRRFSNQGEPITFESHMSWYKILLEDASRQLLIGVMDECSVGVLRYDKIDRKVFISVYLVPEYSGRGIGSSLIKQGTTWLLENWPEIECIEAKIHTNNFASIKAFKEAGFGEEYLTFTKKIKVD